MSTNSLLKIVFSATAIALACGCEVVGKSRILMVTSTTIGVNVQMSKSQQTPEVKIGYNREEFAMLPSDRPEPKPGQGDDANAVQTGKIDGAAASPEALMELNANSNVGLGLVWGGGVYQRLAVGQIAVQQPGAALLMAKGPSESVDATTAKNIVSDYPPVKLIGPVAQDVQKRQVKASDWVRALAKNGGKPSMDTLMSALNLPGPNPTVSDERRAALAEIDKAETNAEMDQLLKKVQSQFHDAEF